MKLSDIINKITEQADEAYAEKWDNSGLQVGDKNSDIKNILLCLDVTDFVVQEAINKNCQLIISHHPLLFNPIKSIADDDVSRLIKLAIKHDVNIYSSHTCFDMSAAGMNCAFAKDFGLTDIRSLDDCADYFVSVDVYVPLDKAKELLLKLSEAGAGRIGNYAGCSFSVNGEGSFTPLDGAAPYAGAIACNETNREVKLELLCAENKLNALIGEIHKYHPYETPVYKVTKMLNCNAGVYMGVIGKLSRPVKTDAFISEVKKYFGVNSLRAAVSKSEKITGVAFCSGSGASFLKKAKAMGADAYITAECKMPDFQWASANNISLICPTHFASEHRFVLLMKRLLNDSEVNCGIEISLQGDYETII